MSLKSVSRVDQVVATLITDHELDFAHNSVVRIPAPEGFTSGDLKRLKAELKDVGIKARAKLTRPPVIVITDIKERKKPKKQQ